MTLLDSRRRRLLFRASHRGTHENDLMIGGYIQPRIAEFTDIELGALEELLELPDVALADWLSGRQPIPDPLAANPMLLAIRANVAAGGAVTRP
jgi:antitoxin CptB